MHTPIDWTCIDAGDAGARFAVVVIQLGADCNLEGLLEIAAFDSSLQRIPSSLSRLHGLGLLSRSFEDLLRSLVECREPGPIREVHEAAAQIQPDGCLASTVARCAEAVLRHALVAQEATLVPRLCACHVIERLSLALLPGLHHSKPAHDAKDLRLGRNHLRSLSHLCHCIGFTRCSPCSGTTTRAFLRKGCEDLRRTTLRPPQLDFLSLSGGRLENQCAILQKRTATASVPFLDGDASEGHDGVVVEDLVVLLGAIAPQRHGHTHCRVVRDGDLTLNQLLALP
mmetsp:Transcript_45850/g.116577  ORF Transcript_45850/g.116577 Transcript_45850/m.116577 type:complete len:284 (-) Transcript_45850:180-1031(-)